MDLYLDGTAAIFPVNLSVVDDDDDISVKQKVFFRQARG